MESQFVKINFQITKLVILNFKFPRWGQSIAAETIEIEIELIFEGNEDLFDLAMIKRYIDDNNFYNDNVILKMYFCPYGQMDRPMADNLFSFKYFAKFINELNFTKVYIKDPHSPVIAAAIDRCIILKSSIEKEWEYDLFFYPDNGAAKKYSEVYPQRYKYGNKKRDLETGKIISYEVIADKEEIEGKKILIKDDICMGGFTFKKAAEELKKMGAKSIDLHITHLMPRAKDFYEHHKDFGIDNFYSDNTLEVDFYRTKISDFKGEYFFLSNFYESPLYYKNIPCRNSESAYQAQKLENEDERRKFSLLSASQAKKLGRQIELRKDWEDIKISEMENICYFKFSQNYSLKNKLINTAPLPLEEGNTWGDTFWGTVNGIGQNNLGKILMRVRNRLIKEMEEDYDWI